MTPRELAHAVSVRNGAPVTPIARASLLDLMMRFPDA
jgi:uncharacterized phage protein (TIGR02216 family)